MKKAVAVPEGYLFSDLDLKKLILPLIVEQFLAVLVGISDSMMVSFSGEAAVSGVSLVDTVFVLIINLFSALTTGGAVVAGHSLGARRDEEGCLVVNQIVLFIAAAGLLVTAILYATKDFLLDSVFGQILPEVRENANTYLLITAASIPFIALYNGGAAIFRAQGNSRLPMWVSAAMNCINVVGNAILIYGAKLGVAGAAIPTLVSRAFAAVAILYLLNGGDRLHYYHPFRVKFDWPLLKDVLNTGVPNGIENSFFQLGKILLLSVISTLGTASITANAIANSVCGLEILAGSAISLALLSVTAQCVGAKDYRQVRYYTRRLMKRAYFFTFCSSTTVGLLTPFILKVYNVSPEAEHYAFVILMMYTFTAMTIWPMSFTFPSVLRASGDMRYCMIVSSCSMWIIRIVGAIFFIRVLNWGVYGAWFVMPLDWLCRSAMFYLRYRRRVVPKAEEQEAALPPAEP